MSSFKLIFTNKKYFSSAFFYSCNSLILSTWITYIPYITEKLGITEGSLGVALFCSSCGALCTIPFGRQIVNKFGVGRMSLFSLIALCLSALLIFLSFNYLLLCIGLFLFGVSSYLLGVSMNSLVGTVEKNDKVLIMSKSHGFFSAGGMIGAGLGSIIAVILNNPLLHLGLVIFIILGIQLKFRKEYYFVTSPLVVERKRTIKSFKPLILLAIVGLLIMTTEQAIADWSSLYLKNISKVDLTWVGLGYAGFSLTMTIGRFMGDLVSKRYGSWQIITVGSLLSISGFAIILPFHGGLTILGFMIVGAGFSVIVPEIYRMASKTSGLDTSTGVAFISATANIGLLFGRLFLGFLAEYKTLQFSFLMLALFVTLAFIISTFSLVDMRKWAWR